MDEGFEYIEDYFQKRHTEAEKRQFEDRCSSDESFAGDVAFYVMSRQAAREELLQQKMAEWNLPGEQASRKHGRQRLSWLPYMAAAVVVLVVLGYFFSRPTDPRQLAEKYIDTHFSRLSQTMGGPIDSLQLGIQAYNDGHYDKALTIFETLYSTHPENSDATKYAGIVCLGTKNYDKALTWFALLEGHQERFANPGAFYEALTLLMRDGKNDREKAKRLLQRVIDTHQEGEQDAVAMIRNLK
jgi:tetratricopeptide (TPR) repeat protein